MKIMDSLTGSYKKKPKQERASKTEQDLLHTAADIIEVGELEDFSAKALSKKSGYSVGVIYKYFNQYEDVFLKIFLNRIDTHFKEVEQIYINHGPHENVAELFGKVVDHAFLFAGRYTGVKNKLIPLFRFFVRRHKTPEDLYKMSDRLVPFMITLQEKDKTNTFKKMSEIECTLKNRAFDHYVRTPMVDPQNTFSVNEHKASCLEFGILIFSK